MKMTSKHKRNLIIIGIAGSLICIFLPDWCFVIFAIILFIAFVRIKKHDKTYTKEADNGKKDEYIFEDSDSPAQNEQKAIVSPSEGNQNSAAGKKAILATAAEKNAEEKYSLTLESAHFCDYADKLKFARLLPRNVELFKAIKLGKYPIPILSGLNLKYAEWFKDCPFKEYMYGNMTGTKFSPVFKISKDTKQYPDTIQIPLGSLLNHDCITFVKVSGMKLYQGTDGFTYDFWISREPITFRQAHLLMKEANPESVIGVFDKTYPVAHRDTFLGLTKKTFEKIPAGFIVDFPWKPELVYSLNGGQYATASDPYSLKDYTKESKNALGLKNLTGEYIRPLDGKCYHSPFRCYAITEPGNIEAGLLRTYKQEPVFEFTKKETTLQEDGSGFLCIHPDLGKYFSNYFRKKAVEQEKSAEEECKQKENSAAIEKRKKFLQKKKQQTKPDASCDGRDKNPEKKNRLRIEIHADGFEIGWNYLTSLDEIDPESYLEELDSRTASRETENYLLLAEDSGSSLHVFFNDEEVYTIDEMESYDEDNPGCYEPAEDYPDIDTPEDGFTAISRDRCSGRFFCEINAEKFEVEKLKLIWCCPDITEDAAGVIAVEYDGKRYDLLPETESNGTETFIRDYNGEIVFPEELDD